MAQRMQVILEDDVDGGPADETVTFSLDGVAYEIDLNNANAGKLRTVFAPWIGNARRTGGRRGGKLRGRGSAIEVRRWARENGYEVSSRGRVPAEIRDAYDKAH